MKPGILKETTSPLTGGEMWDAKYGEEDREQDREQEM